MNKNWKTMTRSGYLKYLELWGGSHWSTSLSHFLKMLTFSQDSVVAAKHLGMLRACLKDFMCCQKLLFLLFNSAYKATVGKIVETKPELSYWQNSASITTVRPIMDQFIIQLIFNLFHQIFALITTSSNVFKLYCLSEGKIKQYINTFKCRQ